MNAPHVPASILGDVLSEAAKAAPAVVGGITQALASRGYPIDLGPMTPDVRRDFAAVDAAIDAELAARRAGADELPSRIAPRESTSEIPLAVLLDPRRDTTPSPPPSLDDAPTPIPQPRPSER